jgi:hypothetical protein
MSFSCVLCVVGMAKKPLSAARGIKKAMAFPSNIIFWSRLPQGCTHSPPEYPRRPGMPCSAARDQLRCEQGTRPGSRAWTRGRPGQRPRTWAQGGAATEQVHGTCAKTANQRLSYCRWCLATPPYGWTGQRSSSGLSDRPREPLGVLASLDRF